MPQPTDPRAGSHYDVLGVDPAATPEQIRATYRRMVAEGAQRMSVELCRGVPPENIRAFIDVAREFE